MSSTVAKTRTRKSPAQRAAEILAAATELAREQGLAALTLRAVADRAGVASGLIAHYHPSMDALVARVYADLVQAEIAEVAALLASGASPTEKTATLFRTLLDGSRDDLTVVWVEGWALARRNAALAAAVEAEMDAWQELVEAVVREGAEAGDFVVADPAEVAWQLIGMIDGLNAQSLARRTDAAASARPMARAAEALLGARPGSLGL